MNPWLKFYPSDWRADPALRMCSIAARGLWMEMLCLMHESEPRGSLLVNGNAVTDRQLAALAGLSPKEASSLLAELEEAGVFSREADGTVYSRRMRRDQLKADRDKANGKRGGNPKIKGGVNPPDKAQKPEARSQKETTPSGVVSAPPPRNDLDELRDKLLDAVGEGNIQPHGVFDLSQILGLIEAGVDLETDILPTIRGRSKTLKRPAFSWKYFTNAIRDAYNDRIEAGQGLSHPKVFTVKRPEDMSEEEQRARWTKVLNYARGRGIWRTRQDGPPPGRDGCLVPADMLDQRDLSKDWIEERAA